MDYTELSDQMITLNLETNRLILRPYTDTDEDGLLKLFQDEQTMWMDGDLPIREKNEEFRHRIALIKSRTLIWIFLEEKCTGEFVGYIMLQDEGDAIAFGSAITADKQHKGYGAESLQSLIEYLHTCGIGEARLKTWEQNLPAQRVAEKLGFSHEKTISNDHFDPRTNERSNSFLYVKKLGA